MGRKKLRSLVVGVALASATFTAASGPASAMPRQEQQNCASGGGHWYSWYETVLKQTVWGCSYQYSPYTEMTDVFDRYGSYRGYCETREDPKTHKITYDKCRYD